jgi:murein DD-endopeptidase
MMKPLLIVIIVFSIAAGEPLRATAVHKTQLKVPSEYRVEKAERREWKQGEVRVILYAREFRQGNAVYIEIIPEKSIMSSAKISCWYENRKIFITRTDWGLRGLFGIQPEEKPGEKKITVKIESEEITAFNYFHFSIGDTKFPVYRRRLKLGKYSNLSYLKKPEVISFIRRSTAKKKEAFSQLGPDMLDSFLAHPRNRHYITSPFWAKRLYYRFKIKRGRRIPLKPKVNIHRGLDLRGKRGEPVFAIASGRVVLAEELFYEGNFIVIDHGNRIFSYYMHQDSIAVKPGQKVRGGDLIGSVGSTGISTAAHLHVSLIINGVQVDPLSILPIPIRE